MSAHTALETGLVRALLALARILPRPALLALGSCAGTAAWLLDGRHRRIAAENLRRCYGPEARARFVRRTVARCFRHFGRITLDSLCLFQRPHAELAPLVTYEGLEHLERAYAGGRGVLLFTGHFGHWELTGLMQGYLGLPLAVVARPLDNPGLERELLSLRARSGNRVIYKRSAVREMLRALGQGIGVAIVIDQDARGDGVFVPFFGQPASTTPTLALLALRTGAPVIPSFSVPREDGTYHVVYEPPVAIERTGDRERDVLELTARCTAILERWVRRHPEAWLWMHRRFKTPPPPSTPGRSAAPVSTLLDSTAGRDPCSDERS